LCQKKKGGHQYPWSNKPNQKGQKRERDGGSKENGKKEKKKTGELPSPRKKGGPPNTNDQRKKKNSDLKLNKGHLKKKKKGKKEKKRDASCAIRGKKRGRKKWFLEGGDCAQYRDIPPLGGKERGKSGRLLSQEKKTHKSWGGEKKVPAKIISSKGKRKKKTFRGRKRFSERRQPPYDEGKGKKEYGV